MRWMRRSQNRQAAKVARLLVALDEASRASRPPATGRPLRVTVGRARAA